jgi:hypothetical protein
LQLLPARFSFSLPPWAYSVLFAAAVVGVWQGSRNRVDPLWEQVLALQQSPCNMLESSVDSLDRLYSEVHPGYRRRPTASGVDSTGFRILATPYLRTLSYEKFAAFCRLARQRIKQRQHLVIAGVTGTGATKIAEKAASFLASDPATQVMIVRCSPESDQEMHHRYIGAEVLGQGFIAGKLLDFWEQCRRSPQSQFVCVIDNFDKINPEAFFGPELWEKLSSSKETAILGGKSVDIPKNCLILSVTHLGPGSKIEFNQEHYKRLGQPYEVEPNACELLDYMRKEARELALEARSDSSKYRDMADLISTANQRRMLYFFLKTNAMLRARYGPGYELGQGSDLKKFCLSRQAESLQQTYINHINSLNVNKPLRSADFDDIEYTLTHRGLAPGTNFFSRQVQWLEHTGYLVEVTMVAATALLTTLIGWWLLRRRERIIRSYGTIAQDIFNQFEAGQMTAEEAGKRLEAIKSEVNDLVLRRDLNYTEGLYFLGFIEDRMRQVEFASSVSANFLELFHTFMEDEVLTESEYTKLCQFLNNIRHKIPEESYQSFKAKVEKTYHATRPAPN